jgi:CelD/BcsL family acetyltransferase involved in cellulose biosynthesis
VPLSRSLSAVQRRRTKRGHCVVEASCHDLCGALTIRSLAAKKPVVECSHRDGDVRCPPNGLQLSRERRDNRSESLHSASRSSAAAAR